MHPIYICFCRMAAGLYLVLNTCVFLQAQPALNSHKGWLRSYTLSTSNKYLVTAGSDGQLGVWDYLSGKPLCFFSTETKVIADVAIGTDEQFVFSIDESGIIKKWQILTGRQVLSFQGHKGSNVTKQRIPFFTEQDDHTESSTRNQIEFPEPGVLTPRLATHKNGHLLSGGQDALLKLWDANTGKLLWSYAGHTAPILALGFSPDGKYCLSYAQDEVLKVWNTLDGKLLNSVELAETPNHPLRFSESDQQLILADTRSVSSWSLPELKKTTLFTLPKSLWALAGGSPGNQLWFALTQDSIALYQIEQKKTIKKIKIGAFHAGLSVDKQGRILFVDAQEKQVKVYDPLKMGIVQVFGVLKSNIQDFKFGPNGKYLLLNDGEENVTVMDWGTPQGIQLKHFPLENPTRNHFYALDDQNQRLLTSSTRGDIKIWNIQTGQSQSFDNEQIRAALNVVWIKGEQNFAAWDFENGAIIYTGKDWLRVPMFSKSADEAAIKAGNYIFQSPITPYYHAAKDFFISRTEREQQKKYGIYKHVGSVDAIYNRDSSRTVFASKGSLLGTYSFETDKLKREDLPVQYAAWVGNQTNMLFVVEDNGAYVKDVEHDLKVLQYALPKAALYQICPSGAHFLLLTPEQNLEIREIMSGKLLATLSWKKGDTAAQVNFNPAAGNSSFTQWAQLQPLLNKPQGAIIQQKLDQLNPHSRKKTTGVVALLPKFGMPVGSISDLVFTKDGKALVGAGYSTLAVWDLPTGRVKYIIEDEFCKEIAQMLSTDDPKIVHIHFKKQGPYSSHLEEALNTTYWALNVETGKINKLPKKVDEAIPTNQLNSKSQDLTQKPDFIGKDLNKWVEFRIAISPLKTYLAFAYKDFFELWDNQKQQLIYKRVLPYKVNDLLFDEKEKQLVISTDDRVQIIDLSVDKVELELDKFEGSLSGESSSNLEMWYSVQVLL
ncbi:WD40 repeat domain-containing protein [Haliscomenobacter sp.]|uniref:WD40 repeat domain-containing protein n=1 Tax=Haliscomenobacter sp. TaxID=2717303 RepID=UPI003BA8F2DD